MIKIYFFTYTMLLILFFSNFTVSASSKMGQVEFENEIKRVQNMYAPLVKQKGGNLKINGRWHSILKGASAEREGNDWIITINGGMLKNRYMNKDSLTLIACHELGHHLGGYPQFSSTWASTEGQADYWAVMKCLRRMFLDDGRSQEIINNMKVPSYLVNLCKKSFSQAEPHAVCVRSLLAGYKMGYKLNKINRLSKRTNRVYIDSPSKKVAKKIINNPSPQCRLDTYVQSALCTTDYRDNASFCDEENGYKRGLRPRCWYPNNSVNQ